MPKRQIRFSIDMHTKICLPCSLNSERATATRLLSASIKKYRDYQLSTYICGKYKKTDKAMSWHIPKRCFTCY